MLIYPSELHSEMAFVLPLFTLVFVCVLFIFPLACLFSFLFIKSKIHFHHLARDFGLFVILCASEITSIKHRCSFFFIKLYIGFWLKVTLCIQITSCRFTSESNQLEINYSFCQRVEMILGIFLNIFFHFVTQRKTPNLNNNSNTIRVC